MYFFISVILAWLSMFKYPIKQVDIPALKKYCIKHVIEIEQHEQHVLLDICINSEESNGWIEGEELLPGLLPLYDEIKHKNYQFLHLARVIQREFNGEESNAVNVAIAENNLLTEAQQAFLECVGIEYEVTS
jgi:hypothetical protein